MSYSVIIPSKDSRNLVACYYAIRGDSQEECRIIVVDDGLSFETFDPVRSEWISSAEFIKGVKPFLFSRNVNLGIRAAGTDDVILLNDDALLKTPGGFAKLARFADEHPDIGVVAPATNVTGQRLQWLTYRTPEGFRFVNDVPYVCVYIPRRTLDKVGLLDERYCLDYGVEDRDHCEAINRAGLKVAILYDVFVDHGSLHSSFRGDPRQPKSFAKNYALFKAKWGIK